jgi:hypothetical protein
MNALLLLFVFSFSVAFNPKRETWELSHYVWNFGLICAADKGIIKNPEKYFSQEPHFNEKLYKDIKPGDIIWVKAKFIADFCEKILPTAQSPFVLLISDGDESFPSECGSNFSVDVLLNHPMVMHIFAQNCDYQGNHSKISLIPIGIDLHTIAYKGVNGGWGEKGSPRQQELQLNAILKQLKPTHLRKKKAFVDFQLSDTMHGELERYKKTGEDRKTIFERLLPTGLIEYSAWMKRSDLWKKKGEYAFSISPHGNGLDCHRTWEDLILGCIVIVKTSCLDPLYDGLPVVIITDWAEITEENLTKWLDAYADAFTNPSYRKKLTLAYWLSAIKNEANRFKGISC